MHALAPLFEEWPASTVGPCEVCGPLRGVWDDGKILYWTPDIVRQIGAPPHLGGTIAEQLADWHACRFLAWVASLAPRAA